MSINKTWSNPRNQESKGDYGEEGRGSEGTSRVQVIGGRRENGRGEGNLSRRREINHRRAEEQEGCLKKS